jgi:hypothetical protein
MEHSITIIIFIPQVTYGALVALVVGAPAGIAYLLLVIRRRPVSFCQGLEIPIKSA